MVCTGTFRRTILLMDSFSLQDSNTLVQANSECIGAHSAIPWRSPGITPPSIFITCKILHTRVSSLELSDKIPLTCIHIFVWTVMRTSSIIQEQCPSTKSQLLVFVPRTLHRLFHEGVYFKCLPTHDHQIATKASTYIRTVFATKAPLIETTIRPSCNKNSHQASTYNRCRHKSPHNIAQP